LKFSLPNPYAPFLENLTLKILPRHIWENVPAKSFALAEFNVKPVGTGPYLVKSFQKDKQGRIKSYELAAFSKYFLGKPHIESLKFIFFDSEESLIAALNKKTVMAGAAIKPKNLEKIKKSGLSVLNLNMPRYYAVFFNAGRSEILENKSLRLALNLAADKSQIVEKALAGKGIIVDSPILPGYLGYGPALKKYEYSPEKAKEILEKAKFSSPLEITLTIPQSPELIEAAAILRDNWQKIGVKTNLRVLAPPEIQEVIKQRDYEAIIFGEILNLDPDPFPFWHSSQKNDPGLNLAMYENKQADKLLEEARQTLKENERAQKYENFQKVLIEDAPAVFLYSPDYIYLINKKIKGIELKSVILPSKRFGEIEKWYIETERVWK
ncbi:MAG: ABC transporter substrate-binding protein, partial [bacterium]|nr:ABC transporter substrate-binding protein [bacterium]